MRGARAPVLPLAVALLGGVEARAQLPTHAEPTLAETHTTVALAPADGHRVFVMDPVFPHLTAAKAYIVDGDQRRVIGMLNAGYVPNLVPAPDQRELYLAETFWSRGTRGKRTDVVSIFDGTTLEAKGEVLLPAGRFLVVAKKHNAGVTPDGRYLLSFNMAPRTTVSLVDVQERRHIGDIETPGCALVFPSAARRFSMLCANGTLRTVRFDAEGKGTSSLSEVFFDAREDPVFEHPAFSKRTARAHFVSYDGRVHPVDLSQTEPRFGTSWSLLDEKDRAESWRPGGWQLAAASESRGRLWVLVHQGPRWSHKQAGQELWEFDLEKRSRVARLALAHPAVSVAVSQDERPQLYLLSENATLAIYDASTRAHLGDVDELGSSPLVLHVVGE